MIRKQVYITEEQNELLSRRAEETGRSQSELIREAINLIAPEHERERRTAILRDTAGLWENRDDLPDWDELRREGDRSLGSHRE